MTSQATHSPGKRSAKAMEAGLPDGDDRSRVVERPDGYYWMALDGHLEIGPFESYELALADRDALGEEAVAPDETLKEAERDLGIAEWFDPETGEPAEKESPHLSEE